MADSDLHNDRFLTASEFFSRAQERLTLDVPVGLADPTVLPQHDAHDTDPAVLEAIAAVQLGNTCPKPGIVAAVQKPQRTTRMRKPKKFTDI
jgi:hypothetical protein